LGLRYEFAKKLLTLVEGSFVRQIKVGVIGTGFIGNVHIEAIRRLGFLKIEAIVEENEELAKKKAKELNIKNYYCDYKKLLENEEIEVVHNCTPNHVHFQINKDAIKAKKHIISEKPLCMAYEEAKELTRLANEANVYCAVNYNYRQYPMVQKMKNDVNSGKLGKIHVIHGYYLQDWLLYDTDYNWRIEEKTGGKSRAIADIGSHWCDLAQYVTGKKIKEVFANLKTVYPVRKKPNSRVETFSGSKAVDYEEIRINTEDCGTVLLRFEDGAIGSFLVSQVSAGHKNDLFIEVDGSSNSYAWHQEKANELNIGHRERANEVLIKDPSLLDKEIAQYAYYPGGHIEGWSEGIKNTFRNFYTCLLEKGDSKDYSFATFEDGAEEMKIIEAILESFKQEKWIRI